MMNNNKVAGAAGPGKSVETDGPMEKLKFDWVLLAQFFKMTFRGINISLELELD
jgi:hypothetical protein